MSRKPGDQRFGKKSTSFGVLFFLAVLLVSCYVYDWSDNASPALSGDDDDYASEEDDITDDDTSNDDDSDEDDSAIEDDAVDDDAADDDTSDDDVSNDVWVDNTSGLMWQNASMSAAVQKWDADSYCDHLILGGESDWRLPTISELRSLIRGCDSTETGGACNVTDGCRFPVCCNSPCYSICSDGSGPNDGCYWAKTVIGVCDEYWSSTAVANEADYSWRIDFLGARVLEELDSDWLYVRCVRSNAVKVDDSAFGLSGISWESAGLPISWLQ
jgi:hypothetical protein